MKDSIPVTTSTLLDIGPAVHQNAGLARYTERLGSHLLAAGARPLALFYNAHSGHAPPASLAQAPTYTLPMGQYAWRMSVLASQIARIPYWPLEQFAASACGGQSVCIYHAAEHLLPRLAIPTVLTVHDLIFERYPQHHTRLNTLYLRAGMPLFVRAATAIIAVSHHTKRDLIELYGVEPAKIHVVHEGVDGRFQPASADDVARVRSQYSPDRPYLLMVGTLEPRKNHAAALRALARLKAAGLPHRLLIAGGKGWLFEPIRALVDQLGLNGDVVFLGYAPDADLPPLYTGAASVICPSLYEGFGFPVLEAMACATPVVCSNVSSLPEVAGGAALLVAPEDDQALADAVHLVLTQPDLANAMRRLGFANASRFRWENCAQETGEVYREVGTRAAEIGK
jgi:glycosyltransferase involved in cell wall biosynthesis